MANTVQWSFSIPDYYKILNVPKTATLEEIHASYRKLSKTCHPDVAKDKELGEEQFKDLGEAYETLHDFDKRQKYDSVLAIYEGYQNGTHSYEEDLPDLPDLPEEPVEEPEENRFAMFLFYILERTGLMEEVEKCINLFFIVLQKLIILAMLGLIFLAGWGVLWIWTHLF